MWIQDVLVKLDRKKAEITFNQHLFDRQEYRNLDLDKIEETVRTGKVLGQKCAMPNKICLQRYFGKENVTYTAIVRFHQEFIEVKTAWPKKGR